MEPRERVKNVALLVLTSDKGLCADSTPTFCAKPRLFLAENKGKYESVQLYCVGKRR
jgi:F0F1-type ATP synthase gamma subunit